MALPFTHNLGVTCRLTTPPSSSASFDEVLNQGRYEVCDEIVAEDFLELDHSPASARAAKASKRSSP